MEGDGFLNVGIPIFPVVVAGEFGIFVLVIDVFEMFVKGAI